MISSSYAPGTRETYGSGLLIFHVFCDQRRIPKPDRCPTSPTLMLAYIACCAGSYSDSTLTTYACAVCIWQIIHGQTWAMNDAELKAALTGAVRLAPPASKQAKRHPWTVALLSAIFGALDSANSLHVAVTSAAAVIFFSAA